MTLPVSTTAAQLLAQAEAMGAFLIAADGVLPEARLAPARRLTHRVIDRLSLTGDHTVAALAGPTGSGKSSLFNLLAGIGLADVGVIRPTTSAPHACLWGPADRASALLDWLAVPAELRFRRESALDGDDQAGLRGLVLIDLPDVDSVVAEHRAQADRLLGLVDLIIWVTDPQKYADHTSHEGYLRAFHTHRDSVIVVLNQVDTLDDVDVECCLADLRRLLTADGLPAVGVLATSAQTGVGGTDLRARLEASVAGRRSALMRLTGEWQAVHDQLAGSAGPIPDDLLERVHAGATESLHDLLDVDQLARAAGRDYRRKAASSFGWPRLPLGKDQTSATDDQPPALDSATGSWPPEKELDSTLDGLLDATESNLPAPWRAAAVEAARSQITDLADELRSAGGRVLTGRGLAGGDPPAWWRWLAWLRIVTACGTLAGGLALVARAFTTAIPVPVAVGLLLCGLIGWLLGTGLAVLLVRAGRRRWERSVRIGLTGEVNRMADTYVVEPVAAVLTRCARADRALTAAGG